MLGQFSCVRAEQTRVCQYAFILMDATLRPAADISTARFLAEAG